MLIIAIIGAIVTPLCVLLLAAMFSSPDNDTRSIGKFIGIPIIILLCLATLDCIINAGILMKETKVEEIDWSQVQVNEYKENDKVVKITYTIGDKTFELPVKEN